MREKRPPVDLIKNIDPNHQAPGFIYFYEKENEPKEIARRDAAWIFPKKVDKVKIKRLIL